MATIPYLRLLRSGGVPTFGIAAFVADGGGSGEPQFYVDCDDVRGRTQNTRNFNEMERADDSVPDPLLGTNSSLG